MKRLEDNSLVKELVRERWAVDQTLIVLRAASRELLRTRANIDRIHVIAQKLRAALKIKEQLDRQLAGSHCTVQFFYPL